MIVAYEVVVGVLIARRATASWAVEVAMSRPGISPLGVNWPMTVTSSLLPSPPSADGAGRAEVNCWMTLSTLEKTGVEGVGCGSSDVDEGSNSDELDHSVDVVGPGSDQVVDGSDHVLDSADHELELDGSDHVLDSVSVVLLHGSSVAVDDHSLVLDGEDENVEDSLDELEEVLVGSDIEVDVMEISVELISREAEVELELLEIVALENEVVSDTLVVKTVDEVESAWIVADAEGLVKADDSLVSLELEKVDRVELDANSVRVAWTVVNGLVVKMDSLVAADIVVSSLPVIPLDADQLMEVTIVLPSLSDDIEVSPLDVGLNLDVGSDRDALLAMLSELIDVEEMLGPSSVL